MTMENDNNIDENMYSNIDNGITGYRGTVMESVDGSKLTMISDILGQDKTKEVDDKRNEKEKQLSFSSITNVCKKFADKTTLHGVNQAVNGKQWWKRLFYFVLLLSSSVAASRNLYNIIQEFLRYPVITSSYFINKYEAEFPSVTICNMNPYRKSKIRGTESYNYLMDLYTRLQYPSLYVEGESMASYVGYLQFDVDFQHQMTDMLHYCLYINQRVLPCGPKDFIKHWGGSCYTFNTTGKSPITRSGTEQGYTFFMDIEREEYLPFTSSTGFRVAVHSPDNPPIAPYQTGILVPTGVVTRILVKKVKTVRQRPPWGDCIHKDQTDDSMNLFGEFGYTYTKYNCETSCPRLATMKYCKCCIGSSCTFTNSKDKNVESLPKCDWHNKTLMSCIQRVTMAGWHESCYKKCKPLCEETVYKTSQSSAPFAEQKLRVIAPNGTEKELNSSNVAQFQIYYDTLQEEVVVTSPAYNWNRLLSDIGGTLGLWLGFSIMTAAEILELVWDIMGKLIRELLSRPLVTNKAN